MKTELQGARVTVIGARGFVGSAFVRHLRTLPGVELREITRDNYSASAGVESDLVIEAACNSKKFLAEKDILQDFNLSVAHRLQSLADFPAKLHLHVSSVDVYDTLSSPDTTRETSPIDIRNASHYGFHKLLAEELVRHHANRWLILRLAGMVGEGLRKNPVFDILNGRPLYIHPDSQYQYMDTDEVAKIAMLLVAQNLQGEIFNLCGDGLISPREIASIAGRELVLSQEAQAQPRIVNVNIDKIKRFVPIPATHASVADFVRGKYG